MKEVSRLLSAKLLKTTPYHAIANGLAKKFNGTLKTLLKRTLFFFLWFYVPRDNAILGQIPSRITILRIVLEFYRHASGSHPFNSYTVGTSADR